jgi:diguanylate cyclase (GGDEF)-like protein
MRGLLPLTLLALLCFADVAGSCATAQGMRGPPPPPGQMPPPPGNGMPPPPPPPGYGGGQSDQQQFPPQAQVQQPQLQQQAVAPGADAASSTPSPTPVIVIPAPVAAATASVTSDTIAHATIDPDAAAWTREATAPARSSTASGQAGMHNTAGSTSGMAPIARIVEMIPMWVWVIVVALPIALLLLTLTVRKTVRLAEETRRLANDQRKLQSAHRFLQNESEHLRHLSINDPLTGVLNRRAFADELRALMDHLSKFKRPLNLMVFDLDHFKSINDQLGHLAGDIALKLVAGVVRKHLNSDDLFGRFGGDEFLIACADRSLDESALLADAIRRAVVEESTLCNPPLPGLSLSIGVARAAPESGYNIDALFQRADTALYSAKHGGRNRVVLSSDDLPRPPEAETVARQLA